MGHTIPQPDDLDHYYGSSYHGNRHGFTATYRAKRRLRIVNSAFAGNATDKRLLDVGCGDGTFLLAARSAGWIVLGTELKPQIARSTGLEVVETIDELPHGRRFDCITLWHSLEHMRDPSSTLARLAALLKTAGVLVIAVPNAAGLQASMFGSNWFHLDVPRHLYHFGAPSIVYLLHSIGFAVERQWHAELEYDLLGWSQSVLNLLMPVPNSFFRALTGRTREIGAVAQVVNLTLGAGLTAAALPAVVAGTVSRRGGTLVTVARRK